MIVGWVRRVRGWVIAVGCLFFVVRAVAEFWVIDFDDSASYRNDWGGPSVAGVLAVHCLPGVIGVVVLWSMWRRRNRPRAGS